MKKLQFTDKNIQELFGHEAAEDEAPERLKEYYFKSSTYEQVTEDLPLRILVGHKGTGKSALFQVAMSEDAAGDRLALVIQPDDILGLAEDTTDFLKTVRTWKTGLLEILAKKAMTGLGSTADDGMLAKLKDYGSRFTDFILESIKDSKYISTDATKSSIKNAFVENAKITVYIDDLDRGWQGRNKDITRISALLNAVRDISNDNRDVRFKIALRADVYFLVRTSDESTDKIEGSVIWQTWTQHEILVLLIKRINTFLGKTQGLNDLENMTQVTLSKFLNDVFEPTFSGRGHWSGAPIHTVLMSLIRKRPRDLVKLCTLAARRAHAAKSSIIRTSHLEDAFEEYSQGRLQDTINEFRTELPQIESLLFGMRPSKREKKAREGYLYSTEKLIAKIKTIEDRASFKFSGNRPASAKDLAAFMYKINFLTARKDTGSYIDRKFFEESRYLQNNFVDFGYDWEVHPAYRWALQPDDIRSIFNELKLTKSGSW